MAKRTKSYTYDEWNEQGYYIRKGEKATFKDGKFYFSPEQVEKKNQPKTYNKNWSSSYTSNSKRYVSSKARGRQYEDNKDWDELLDDGYPVDASVLDMLPF